MKEKMEKSNLVIIILISIITILAIILGLKMKGVIKPIKHDIDKIEKVEIMEENNNPLAIFDENLNKMNNYTTRVLNIIDWVVGIFSIILIIGLIKLYKKINLTPYAIRFTIYSTILFFINNYMYNGKNEILDIIISILNCIILCNYYKALGISIKRFVTLGIMEIILSMFIPIVPIMGIVILGIALVLLIDYIKSNIILGKIFNKSTIFIIGLCILPFIFQPILGYMRTSIQEESDNEFNINV